MTYRQLPRACGLALILFLAAEQASTQDAVQLCREKGTASDTAIPGADGQANIRPQDAGPASAAQHCFPLRRGTRAGVHDFGRAVGAAPVINIAPRDCKSRDEVGVRVVAAPSLGSGKIAIGVRLAAGQVRAKAASRDFNETLGKVDRLVGATRLQGSMASDNATPAPSPPLRP